MNIENCHKYINLAKQANVKVSSNFLRMKLDCTKKGQKICQGRCCKGHHNEINLNKVYVKYSDEEWKHIPNNIKKQIEPHLNKDKVVQNKDNICMLKDFCLKNPKYKPIECKLYPLTFTKDGLLILDNWAKLHCPNYKKGNLSIYKALKKDLIDIFGKKTYREIVKQCEGDLKKWM